MNIAVLLTTAKFCQGGDQDLEMLRSVMLALEESLNEAGDHGALHGGGLAVFEFFGGGNAISAGVLGDIHSSIRHADQVLDLKAVHWEAGDAEAASDVMLAEHGIGGDPQA